MFIGSFQKGADIIIKCADVQIKYVKKILSTSPTVLV